MVLAAIIIITINEKTKLFYGIKEATKAILDFISNADTAIDACLDPTGPSVMMGVDAIKNERLKANRRGVNFRYVTEVTKDNLSYCKELSEFAEVRHLNGVKGNFEISKIRIKGEGERRMERRIHSHCNPARSRACYPTYIQQC